jgi:hypothetical protein
VEFQWTFNGTNIPGATNKTLTLTNLQPSEAGSYVLYVSNNAGSANSSPAILSLVPVFSQYASNVLANNPIDYWRFNDGQTTYAYDYAGGVTMTDLNWANDYGSGPPIETNGPVPPNYPGFESTNTAPWLDGSTQGYQSTVSLMNGMSNYTMMGWFCIDPTQYPFGDNPYVNPGGRASLFGQEFCGELGFVGIGQNGDASEYPTYTGSKLYFYPGANQTGETIEVTNGWSVGGWNFIAVTVNSTTGLAALYLNGAAVEGAGGPDTISGAASSQYSFSVGLDVAYPASGGVDNAFFPGSIDEVAVFDYPLSASAIQAIYQSSLNFSISITRQAGGVQISWPAGQLQSATSVSGPWQTMSGATSPLVVTPGATKFYRAVVNTP